MELGGAYKTSRVIESLENYARSDHFADFEEELAPGAARGAYFPMSDYQFWKEVLGNPGDFWNKTIELQFVGLSEWVARVPGLFFARGSETLRRMADGKVELVEGGRWATFRPEGKSEKVMGGVGTIQLPAEEGYQLASVSFTNNASTGIPVLIPMGRWANDRLGEGLRIYRLTGTWRKMKTEWARRFPSVTDIPKGYLEVERLELTDEGPTPTVFHPFTIMEYENRGGVFYDYVFVTVDATRPAYREKVHAFFTDYKDRDDRHGRYLIEPFVHQPLLDGAVYGSPQELRSRAPEAESHLDLLVARIRRETFDGRTIGAIKAAMDNHLSTDQLRRLSDVIGLNPNRWMTGRALVHESAALLDLCLDRNKVEELVDALGREYPHLFSAQ